MATWRTALVTGSSSGIGEAMARQLAAQGVDLVLVARREAELRALADELTAAHGVNCEVLPTDLVDVEDLAIVAARLAADPPVDLLVNNAGMVVQGPVGSNDIDAEVASIDLNCSALLRLMHAAIPGMRERGRGSILNVSSLGAFQPAPNMSTYAATKAFVNSLSQGAHEELRGTGVTVTAVCPGFTRTGFGGDGDGNTDADDFPDAMWQTAEEVAAEALEAAAAGRAVRVTGTLNKVIAGVTGTLPLGITRRLAGEATRRL